MMATSAPHARPAFEHEERPGDSPLLVRALRGEAVERAPVWFMRQAGRSLPEYHRVRAGRSLLEVVQHPEQVAEITLQPVWRHGVDAAILYSDIVAPLAAMGVGVEIRPGVGPVIAEPIRSRADLDRFRQFDPQEHTSSVSDAIGMIRSELSPDRALIGFAGAPFTLASYLVEGGPSKQQARTKAMMLGEPRLFRELLDALADIVVASLRAQVAAGVQAVQIFDSWIGSLSDDQYRGHIQPVVTRVLRELDSLDVPRIVFGVGTGHLLESLAATGADAVGVDWRTPLPEARMRLGDDVALQGNLDPACLLAGWETVDREVRAIVARAPERGYVFNLGHGMLPDTPANIPGQIVELVRELTS